MHNTKITDQNYPIVRFHLLHATVVNNIVVNPHKTIEMFHRLIEYIEELRNDKVNELSNRKEDG